MTDPTTSAEERWLTPWNAASPGLAFAYLVAWMLLAVVALLAARRDPV